MNYPEVKISSNIEYQLNKQEIDESELLKPVGDGTYEDIKESFFQYFQQQDYEIRQGFEEGYSRSVSEEYDNIDLIQNLNDIIYDYCRERNKELTVVDKSNFKNLHAGLQYITKAIKQYDKGGMDKIFVGVVLGYMLKVMRNYYHD